jgi:hypothetical protein
MSINSTVSDALLDVQKNKDSLSSLKRFGIVIVFLTLLSSLFVSNTTIMITISFVIGCISIFLPRLLDPFYWLLQAPLNILLNLVLAILFYTIICPLGFCFRLLKIDIIQQNIQPELSSYWGDRTTQIPHGKYMRNQR